MLNIYNNKPNISNALLSISKRISKINDKSRTYGTDVQLFNAEIHMIKVINENEGIHITALAEYLNITKGSVSEIIRKLKKKEMVIKEVDPENMSRICLRLTKKGKEAYQNHENLHKLFDKVVDNIIDQYPELDRAVLNDCLLKLDNTLSLFEE